MVCFGVTPCPRKEPHDVLLRCSLPVRSCLYSSALTRPRRFSGESLVVALRLLPQRIRLWSLLPGAGHLHRRVSLHRRVRVRRGMRIRRLLSDEPVSRLWTVRLLPPDLRRLLRSGEL